MRIIEYKIVVLPDWQDVRETVNESIEKGWQPLGGVSVAIDHYPKESCENCLCVRFAQAMVRYGQ